MRFLTSGESHGPSLNVIIDGFPSGVQIEEALIKADMQRRRTSAGRSPRSKFEEDAVEILSGVRGSVTLGTPICLEIRNADYRNWEEIMGPLKGGGEGEPLTLPRPGHADMAGIQKRGFTDIRNVLERSSARETAARVAAGSFAKALLRVFGISLVSHTISIGAAVYRGPLPTEKDTSKLDASPVRCLDKDSAEAMVAAIDDAAANGDSLGGTFEVIAYHLPPGLGDYGQWDLRLDGLMAQAIVSIPGIKGVEFGSGFALASTTGSNSGDELYSEKGLIRRKTNRMGGVEGGMSNGEPLILRAAMKPIPTIKKGLPTVDIVSGESSTAFYERSDVCAVSRAAVIGEAMVALVLADALCQKFGGDSLADMQNAFDAYQARLKR